MSFYHLLKKILDNTQYYSPSITSPYIPQAVGEAFGPTTLIAGGTGCFPLLNSRGLQSDLLLLTYDWLLPHLCFIMLSTVSQLLPILLLHGYSCRLVS